MRHCENGHGFKQDKKYKNQAPKYKRRAFRTEKLFLHEQKDRQDRQRAMITALLLIAVIFYRRLFFAEEPAPLLFAAALAGSFVVGLLTAFHVKVSNKAAENYQSGHLLSGSHRDHVHGGMSQRKIHLRLFLCVILLQLYHISAALLYRHDRFPEAIKCQFSS